MADITSVPPEAAPETAAPPAAASLAPQQGIAEHVDFSLAARAAKALASTGDLAKGLNMPEVATGLQGATERIQSDTFQLMVYGRFKTGKSTLINALLGPFDLDGSGAKGVMATGRMPTTAILTTITYAEKPFIQAWRTDGKVDDWTFSKYLQLSSITVDGTRPPELEPVREFGVGLPVALCKNNINLLDSPGLDEDNERTRVTLLGAQRCDAILAVVKSEGLLGQGEIADIAKVKSTGVRTFVAVNLWGDDVKDEPIMRRTWNLLVRDVTGEVYDPEGFERHDIYFIDARDGYAARESGDAAALEASGLPLLERRLGEFLTKDRVRVHLSRHLVYGTKLLDTLGENIAFRRKTLETETANAQAQAESLMPRIEAIKARPLKLIPIFEAVVPQATSQVQSSFDALVAQFRADLPAICEGVHLEEEDGMLNMMTAPFKIRSISETIVNAALREWEDRLDDWQDVGVVEALDPITDRIEAEVREEVTQIEQDIQSIKFTLADGWKPTEVEAGSVTMADRVLSGLLTFATTGNVFAAAMGGALGWRGAVGGIVGSVGGFLAVMMVASITPIGFGAAIIAVVIASLGGSVMGGAFNLTKRVKAEVATKLDGQFAGATETMRPKIAEQVRASIAKMGEDIRKVVDEVVREECETVEGAIRSTQLSKADKEAEIAKLDDAASRIAASRQELRDLNLEVEQTV